MEILLLFGALVFLLVFNAFFVIAEFSIVKVRASRVEQLAEEGDARAKILLEIQDNMDNYLGVAQVGITLASVALGMVGQRTAQVIMGGEDNLWRYALAMAVSYLIISGSHILLGEQVPKSIAIRIADKIALRCARPLRWCHRLFYPALWILAAGSRLLLRLIGMGAVTTEEEHSEKELRIILDQSQERGLMSFRRLLYMENIFDLGGLTVRDAMRRRSAVQVLDARKDWPENLAVIQSSHRTRYPLLLDNDDWPAGFVHVKDMVIQDQCYAPDLRSLVRPLLSTSENTQLENLLAEMQRRRIHLALVKDREGTWTGFITLEDVMEEIVGTIRDEFEGEENIRLIDALATERVHFDIEANSPVGAVRSALSRMGQALLPVPKDQILAGVEERERIITTYLGMGIGMPHARIPNLNRPFLMILRSNKGIRYEGTTEKAQLLFVLLTPAGQPRVHQWLQSIIATILHESEFVKDRLLTASSQSEVLDVIRTAEQAVLD